MRQPGRDLGSTSSSFLPSVNAPSDATSPAPLESLRESREQRARVGLNLFWPTFFLLALLLVGTYLAIRREWFSPGLIAGVSIVGSIILMVLTSLGQGNSAIQAIVVGIVVGGIFSGVTVGTAWYFHSQEMQQHYVEGGEEVYPEESYAESD